MRIFGERGDPALKANCHSRPRSPFFFPTALNCRKQWIGHGGKESRTQVRVSDLPITEVTNQRYAIAVAMLIAEHPHTDPGVRDSRTGLPPCYLTAKRSLGSCVHQVPQNEVRKELGKGGGLFPNARQREVAAAGAPQGHGSGAGAQARATGL
jgi:hypothetical protein